MFKFTHGNIVFTFSSAPESIDIQEGKTMAHQPIVKDAKEDAALDLEVELLEKVIQENQPLPEQLQLVSDAFSSRRGPKRSPHSIEQQVLRFLVEKEDEGFSVESARAEARRYFEQKGYKSGFGSSVYQLLCTYAPLRGYKIPRDKILKVA